MPSSLYRPSRGQRSKREPGVPWFPRTGKPLGSPQVANASVRPSGVSTVLSRSATTAGAYDNSSRRAPPAKGALLALTDARSRPRQDAGDVDRIVIVVL